MAKSAKKIGKGLKITPSQKELELRHPLANPDYYFNRELSWLDFNLRVIEEAYDKSNPLLEQLNFLAIASSNADEFFMVRVAGVYAQYVAQVPIAENKTYMAPLDVLQAIRQKTTTNIERQYSRYHALMDRLPDLGYQMKRAYQLSPEELWLAERIFQEKILPTLTPLGIDAYRPFPYLNSRAINILVTLKNQKGKKQKAILPLPSLLERYITLDMGSRRTLVLSEDIIIHFIDQIFSGYEVNFSLPFRITRDADFDYSEEGASDLLRVISDSLKKRKNGEAVRIEVDTSVSQVFEHHHIDILMKTLELEDFDLYQIAGPLDLTFLFGLREQIGQDNPQARFSNFEPYLKPDFKDKTIFDLIQTEDQFFYHPYDSFQPIVSLVEQAAQDPQTIAIKQTLYRVSKNSPIVATLKKAAENGKEVTVLVELKARFDEENNVHWARELEEAGCHVLYGVSELKTHSKITLVIRKEGQKIQGYVHLGTGNYNDKTAKIYTDMGIMTCQEGLIEDARQFFNHLSGFTERPDYQHLHVSPFEIRDSLIDHIDEEIAFQQEFQNGHIIAKMNSLTDKTLIKKLYQASQAGVKIDLIIRGVCCLKPGIEGISDNIRVISIVGRFLEHARVYYFNRNNHHHLFLSSADMMTRNMINRVEIEFPILSKKIKAQILDILNLQLADTLKSRELTMTGDYIRPDRSHIQANSQEQLLARIKQQKEVAQAAHSKPKRSWLSRILRRFNEE